MRPSMRHVCNTIGIHLVDTRRYHIQRVCVTSEHLRACNISRRHGAETVRSSFHSSVVADQAKLLLTAEWVSARTEWSHTSTECLTRLCERSLSIDQMRA